MNHPLAASRARLGHCLLASSLLLSGVLSSPLAADEGWTQWFGGAGRDASRPAPASISQAEQLSLKEVWRQPFGSGYSALAVAGGLVVTGRADQGSDYVVALDSDTGEERWRFRLEKTYKGHDGSHDGPLSSPANDGSQVLALSARGRLVALKAADGQLQWERNLVSEEKLKRPHYGFATSPLVIENLVVVEGGPKKKGTVVAFDRRTGKTVWRAEVGSVAYASPAAAELGGEMQVVVCTSQGVTGLRISDGQALWLHPKPVGDCTPVPFGGDKLLVGNDNETRALRVRREEGRYEVTDLWRSTELADPWGPVVVSDDAVYGVSDGALTSLDAKTGATNWSHDPVGGTLARLGELLVIIVYKDGSLHLAEASPERYRARGDFPVLDQNQSLTGPAFADGRIYLRSRKEIMALRLVPENSGEPASPSP